MAGQTISAHIDEMLAQRLKESAKADSRAPSQIVGIALQTFLQMTPSARRVAFSIDGSASEPEKALAARMLSRAMLRASQSMIEARNMEATRGKVAAGTNAPLLTEEDIENEAARACRT